VDETTALRSLVSSTVEAWVGDPDMPAEYSEWVEGRLAVRIQQSTRDVSTVWVDIGERTVGFEVYVVPAPQHSVAEVHRQLLRRNDRTRFVRFSIDADGEIYLRARLATEWVDAEALESVFAELSEAVDTAFRSLVRTGFGRATPAPGS